MVLGFFHFFMRGFAFLVVSYTAAVFSNYGGGGGKILLSKLAQWYFAAVLFELFRHFKIEDLLFNPTAFAACPTVSNNCPVSIHLIPLNVSFSKSL